MLPKPGDKNIQAPSKKIVVLTPQLRKDLFPLQDPVLIAEKIIQQFRLTGRQNDLLFPADAQLKRILVELHISPDNKTPVRRL